MTANLSVAGDWLAVRHPYNSTMTGFACFLSVCAHAALDIRDFGAVGDGVTMCTQAVQRAIDKACIHGNTVNVPSGRFLCGTIHLKSHVDLHLDQGAVILGSTKRHDYDHGVWYSLLMAANVHDFAITGTGTIDDQGAELAKDVLHMVDTGEIKIPPKGWRPSEIERPEIIEFTDCQQFRVEGVAIKNSCCWVQTYRNCTDLTIAHISVDSKTYWNNDGIDLVDCKNAAVTDCDVDCGDDGICLKSDRPTATCDNISIKNCRIRSSASAIKFGTASHGGFRNIRIDGISVRDTFRSAVALESVDGGTLENVEVSNVKATHTGNAFFIRLGHRNRRVPPGRVRHIVLRNFEVEIPAGRPDFGYPFKGPQFTEPHNLEPSSIVGHTEQPIEDVRLENIRIHTAAGGSKSIASANVFQVPERATDYPEFTMFGELPAWALYIRHARGITIKNLTVIADKPDYRPPFVTSDVVGLNVAHVTVKESRAQILLHDTKRAKLPKNLSSTITH